MLPPRFDPFKINIEYGFSGRGISQSCSCITSFQNQPDTLLHMVHNNQTLNIRAWLYIETWDNNASTWNHRNDIWVSLAWFCCKKMLTAIQFKVWLQHYVRLILETRNSFKIANSHRSGSLFAIETGLSSIPKVLEPSNIYCAPGTKSGSARFWEANDTGRAEGDR